MSGVWTPGKAAGKQPFPRSYHTASELNGKIYIFGGKEDGAPSDSTLYILNTGLWLFSNVNCKINPNTIYSAGLKSWNIPKTTGVPPSPRYGHTANMVDKKMYVFGGHGDKKLNDHFVLNSG